MFRVVHQKLIDDEIKKREKFEQDSLGATY